MKLRSSFGAVVCLLTAFFTVFSVARAEILVTPEEEKFNVLTAAKRVSGPLLIFSDSPEEVHENGVLYRDTAQGKIRIFLHHVNMTTTGMKKLAVLLENTNSLRPVAYRVTRRAVGGGHWRYVLEGKVCQERYFAPEAESEFLPMGELGFGNSEELLTGQGVLLKKNQILNGIIEVDLSRPARVSVVFCEPQQSPVFFAAEAQQLPVDQYPLRGTFVNADWEYTLKKTLDFSADDSQACALTLASSEEGFAHGLDATTGKLAENRGNYGIIYKVNFMLSGNRSTRFQFNPLGGEFAGWAVLIDGQGRRQLVELPSEQISYGFTIEETQDVAVLPPGRYSFIWSPPGASNLPVRLLWRPVVPQSMRARVGSILKSSKAKNRSNF